MTSGGTFSLGSPDWIFPALALSLVAVAALAWSYRRSGWRGRSAVTATLARAVACALLAFALVEPSWTTRHARPGANLFVVLADGSRGMRLRDGARGPTRADTARAALVGSGAPAWLKTVGETFQLRRYGFDARLHRLDDFTALRFDGDASHLGSALRSLGERYRGAPLAGILVVSDGNATDLDGATFPAGLPPVFTATVGAGAAQPDVAVASVTATSTAFEDAPVTVEARVEAIGNAGRTLAVELSDERGRVVATERLAITRKDETATARLRFRPEAAGLSFYKVRVTAAPGTSPVSDATAANDARLVAVERPRGPHRVLYVGGRPNWELKFLRRALEGDPQVQLISLVRLARREPRFTFLGRPGESANPLFRGFGASDGDDTARHDEPVLVRLGTRDAAELKDGFPRTEEALFAYHAIILDDLEASFLDAHQQALLERFVSARGGGFLMLGGQESFRQGGWDRTPVGALLPVHLEGPTGAAGAPVRFALSREGWLEAWARLRDSEAAERERVERMPGFRVENRARGVKPGATILATVASGNGALRPALAVQRAGAGRAGAITIGDLWRWGLRDPELPDDLARFWRQTVRWLVAETPERVTVRAERAPGELGDALALRVRVRDARFRPADTASVKLEVVGPGNERTELAAEADETEPGLYQAVFVPKRAGAHRVLARATAGDGTAIGQAQGGWATDLDADEHRSVRANPALMAALSQRTAGRVIALDDLDEFARTLPARIAPVTESRTRPLWHTPLLFALALALLALEWTLRRRRGLP